ncbi:transporter substrate-binding domain-containing protein [Marinomonas sp. 15G1-11]|uniref:Transporter substrate-binding domain-containing protein n=1 Tax=Marinomonas phaeophyticola TaxID=3004091 RepID=A0ABT4JSX8_9GAMM|nr:transporter substrate-binding domain-containing protein [Marinomonas sp. 15G1-11]MCZ2721479.1 transporter substrate-binding domain-containing protein [Marinomonas sp. 15G1-11]
MKKTLGCVISLCCSLSAVSHAETIKLTTMNWAPFYAEELDRNGFVTAIVQESLAASGYDSEIEFTEWNTALKTVEAGTKDAIVGGYFSEERQKVYNYSIPIYTVLSGLVKTKNLDLDLFTSFDQLNSYKMGKVAGGVVSKEYDSFQFNSLTGFDTTKAAVIALSQGEIDLYADNLSASRAVAQGLGIDPMSLELVQPPLEQNDLYLLISKSIPNSDALRDAFNQGLITIQSNGVYQKILEDFNQN